MNSGIILENKVNVKYRILLFDIHTNKKNEENSAFIIFFMNFIAYK